MTSRLFLCYHCRLNKQFPSGDDGVAGARSHLYTSRQLTKHLLRGLLVAVDVSLEVLTEGGELLVRVLEDALPRQLGDAI